MTTYGFIEPDPSLSEVPFDTLHERLGIAIYSGFRAHLTPFAEDDEDFGRIVSRIHALDGFEDQCSARYYYDMCDTILKNGHDIQRIVEVGVYMGGASVLLAGCAEAIGADLVMIDIDARHLQFSYQRLLRSFPDAARYVRLFHGDLPTYVRDVLVPEGSADRFIVQLDGSHAFNDVVRDLGTLSFVQDRLHGIMAQDTHLRGMPQGVRFIDAALFSVFGGDFQYVPIGSTYSSLQADLMTPNQYGGNYFLPDKPEGMYLPMSHNQFEYPHPLIRIDDFFW